MRGVILVLVAAAGQVGAQGYTTSTRISAWGLKPPPSGHVAVTVTRSDVWIQGTDKDSVFVALFWRPPAGPPGSGEGIPPRYTARQTPTAYEFIDSDSIDGSFHSIQVSVPRNLKQVTLKLTNMGRIRVTDFDGEISIDSRGGEVLLLHTSGVAFINSRDGDVRAVVDRLPAAGSGGLHFQANNGNIILTLPEDTKASMQLDANRGSIYSDFLPNQFQLDRTTIAGSTSGSGISTLPGTGQVIQTRWTTGPGGTRMDLNPFVMSGVGIRRGESAVNVRASTINGSVIVTKGGASIPPK